MSNRLFFLFRAFVDQASAALLYFKLHQLAVVLSPTSSLFYIYFPACLLSDLVAVGFLQAASHYLFREQHHNIGLAWTPLSQQDDEEYWADKSGHVDDAASTEIQKLQQPTPRRLLRYAAIATLLFCCFVSISASVLAAGIYDAGKVVFSWEEALNFESSGQSDFLISFALENWSHFFISWFSITIGGLAITASKLVLRRVYVAYQQDLPIRKLAFLSSAAGTIFILSSLLVRPSSVVPATDLLLDGFGTSATLILAIFGFSAAPIFQPSSDSLYGSSNVKQPRIARLPSPKKLEHVFHIFLESADGLAWPFSPEFCEQRNCQDIKPEYNTAEHMTPFFASLVNDPNTYYTPEMKSTVAYTTKSHFASMCGQHPQFKAFVTGEAHVDTPLPCLPKLLRALDPNFSTAFYIPHNFDFDNFGKTTNRTGYQEMFGRERMEEEWTKQGVEIPERTNYFGYSDTELDPFAFAWIDKKLANKERIFMTVPGGVMHYPWLLPPAEHLALMNYTWQSHVTNNYLNTVRWTDNHLKLFFAGLEKRGLLENSLIVIQGDHGPRIDKEGITSNSHHFDSGIFQVPLLIRMPGLSFDKQPSQPFVSLDIVPTVLDALGADNRIIEKYVGHSIFRRREGPAFIRNTFHAQIPGNSFIQVTRKEENAHYKAVMLNKDICVTDTMRDPYEEFLYCAQEGWRKANADGVMEDGLTKGLYTEDDEKTLKQWVFEAATLIGQHTARNKADWAEESGRNHTLNQQEVLQQLATYSLVH